ncbi:DUF6443 domain-containing protein [Flavihumibacter fluvii]|uniref:DUF6443 domain-containing protein n=1 Tax=Flavihumibacter fluvii TaxID=2838157 RepID=UPI001BDE0F88|nr:DUF6443 domain-containing protein [Flavihumibacter fluvii]ULQ52152.1 RHS repeat-associated core domain-containing protein [Flavihumibacter fluvii]
MAIRKIIIVLLVIACTFSAKSQSWYASHSIGTLSGKYQFTNLQIPDQIVEVNPPSLDATGFTYIWESSSSPLTGFSVIAGSASSYTFSSALSATKYFRRITRHAVLGDLYSNTIKIAVVSLNWEDKNYVRENTILISGVYNFNSVDVLPIGDRIQTTRYMDGMGRVVQQIGREMASPAVDGGTWGDIVSFNVYDNYGREMTQYLPYTSTTTIGKIKNNPATDQQQYYSTNFSETNAFNTVTDDNSPLKRVLNVKESGTVWSAGTGVTNQYLVNSTTTDDVKMFKATYVAGAAPNYLGSYPDGALFKTIQIDQQGKSTIEFTDKNGLVVLKKVQIDNVPANAYSGWACTYYVYDDFDLLRFVLQPEATNYLYNNSWSFTGTNGATILDGYCHQYIYDAKGRIIWKKAASTSPIQMIYDSRDRLVFSQDGNQLLKSPAEWTSYLYDVLDRVTTEVIYKTTKTLAQLQADAITATPISSTDLSNASICTILKYNYYDNYSFTNVKAFDNVYDNGTAYPLVDPNIMTIGNDNRTLSRLTGTSVRVLGSSTFLNTTNYYNYKGLPTQKLSDNIKTGTDILTYQYGFDGRLLSAHSKHTTTGTGYTNFGILTKQVYDKIGRLKSIDKKFGTNAFETIAEYSYDDLGRLKKKRLDPGYTGSGKQELESLDYSYNLHGSLTGINADYALKKAGTYDKWGKFFGVYFGYDNRDAMFGASRLNGQIGGVLWNSQGDDVQRRFDMSYDNASRLSLANFNERATTGAAWSKASMDFTVSGSTGNILYDLNGNLVNLKHMGVVPGTATPVIVDQLSYTYALSNKLVKVTDGSPLGTKNGKFGDFVDGSSGSGDDYIYDANGNLVKDLNKEIRDLPGLANGTGARYNYLDKPEEINIAGKGKVTFVYSADGQRLQKVFTPTIGTVVTTSYINGYVYKDNELQYINFEEGRIRVIQEVNTNNGYDQLQITGNLTLPNSKKGVFDYYLRDNQENVRMILTEQDHLGSNQCNMETARASVEEPLFGQTGAGNEVVLTRFAKASIPGQGSGGGWNNANIGSYVSRVGKLAAKKTGPNALLKVMAGDLVSGTVQYFYKSPVVNSTTSNGLAADVLLSLGQALAGSPVAGELAKGASSGITSLLGASAPFNAIAAPNATDGTGNAPKAYLTVLFFDERFNYIGENSNYQRVSTADNSNASLNLLNIKAPKNGYAYVYLSNESDEMVYFDNLQVSHNRGRIIEENHYYAYGLRIDGISSRKVGDVNEGRLTNNNLYNDKELFAEGDLNWYDYGFRDYDPQIARFVEMDPIQDLIPGLSSYHYASNDPITNIDFAGLFGGIPCPNLGPVSSISSALAQGVGAAATAFSLTSTASAIVNTETVNNTIFGNISTTSSISGNFDDGQIAEASDPKDKIRINTKTKELRILETDEDFDMVSIDGAKPVRNGMKGATVAEYRKKGYWIGKEPQGVGDGSFWGALVWLGGNKLGNWIYKGVSGWFAKTIATEGISAKGAVWAQKTFSGTFSSGGKFAGQTVEGVAEMLRNGTLSAAEVPINVVVRNGQTFILNTRSSAALMQAGIPRSAWNLVNQTGITSFEEMLTDQLIRNGLINGTNTIRQSGTQLILTH